MLNKEDLKNWIEEYLSGTEYELITLNVSAGNNILVEVDRLTGVDVDFCAELNRFLVEKLDAVEPDYSLEVGSVSLTDPFKTKMQYQKNLGHDVEVLVEGKKLRGQLVWMKAPSPWISKRKWLSKAKNAKRHASLPIPGGTMSPSMCGTTCGFSVVLLRNV